MSTEKQPKWTWNGIRGDASGRRVDGEWVPVTDDDLNDLEASVQSLRDKAETGTWDCAFGCEIMCQTFNTNVCQVFTPQEHLAKWRQDYALLREEMDEARRLAARYLEASSRNAAQLTQSQSAWHGLFEAIKHGDDGHQTWLKAAIEAYFTGQPMPEVVMSQSQSEVRELRAALEKVDLMREKGEVVEEWLTKCQTCDRDLTNNFCIYVEDRDGRTFDGKASILASFLFCGPKCLKSYAEDYGRA